MAKNEDLKEGNPDYNPAPLIRTQQPSFMHENRTDHSIIFDTVGCTFDQKEVDATKRACKQSRGKTRRVKGTMSPEFCSFLS